MIEWPFYTIIILVGLLLVGSYFILGNIIQKLRLMKELIREKTEIQLKEVAYKTRMNDLTMATLTLQMNPHFIFNCLTSIKFYIEQNDNKSASAYLTMFSKLIRNMLEHTQTEKIFLASEIESLRLYLEMESMRFKDKLQYTIDVDQCVDLAFIEIPQLVIQPYVENAIKHGLMNRKNGGTLSIHISQSENKAMLIINIRDNGIGREKAAEIKLGKTVHQISYGTRLTGERIALLNEKYQTGAGVTIADLFDANHESSGTLVTIKLPLK